MLAMSSLFETSDEVLLHGQATTTSATPTTAEPTTNPTTPPLSPREEFPEAEDHRITAATSSVEEEEPAIHFAKLYRLGEMDREWQEFGFVRVHAAYVDRVMDNCLVLVDDASRQVSFEVPISAQLEYKREAQSTILTWQDTLYNFTTPSTTSSPWDMALSFETVEGCDRIWESICLNQGKVSSDFRPGLGGSSSSSFEDDDARGHDDLLADDVMRTSDLVSTSAAAVTTTAAGANSVTHSGGPSYKVTRENLDHIVKRLRATTGAIFKSRFIHELTLPDDDYANFRQTLAIYDAVCGGGECEDAMAQRQELINLFELVKYIALFDEQIIFDLMLREDNFPRVAGCLENDPGLPFQAEHRKFLAQAKFHEICPIASEEVRNKIHYRFRLGFLRDVLLARVLDDSSFKRLNGMDTKVSCEIALGLHEDERFLPSLFALLLPPRPVEEEAKQRRSRAVALFAEFNSLVQKLAPMQKQDVYRTMFADGDLFSLILYVLFDGESTTKEKLDFEEILQHALKHDSILFQEKMMRNEVSNVPEASLMGILVSLAINDADCGVQAMACNLLEILLDPETHSLSSTPPQVDAAPQEEDLGGNEFDHHPQQQQTAAASEVDDIPFFGHFYAKHFMRLLQVLLHPPNGGGGDARQSETLHLVTSLICFCIQTHGYVIRQVLAAHQTEFATAIANLLGARDKFLVLDGIRFARVLIGMKERFYDDFVMEHHVLELILQRFVANGGLTVNNLLQSAVIDLFETIFAQNCDDGPPGSGANLALLEHASALPDQDLREFKTFAQLDALLERKRASSSSSPRLGGGGAHHAVGNDVIAMASPQNIHRAQAMYQNSSESTNSCSMEDDEPNFLGVSLDEDATAAAAATADSESAMLSKKPRLKQDLPASSVQGSGGESGKEEE